jgi:hypothetical protein
VPYFVAWFAGVVEVSLFFLVEYVHSQDPFILMACHQIGSRRRQCPSFKKQPKQHCRNIDTVLTSAKFFKKLLPA